MQDSESLLDRQKPMPRLNGPRSVFALFLLCTAAMTSSSAQTFTTLLTFDGTDGSGPSALVQSTDGAFYGTTSSGGLYRSGTAFRGTPNGKLIQFYSFCALPGCADGSNPTSLVLADNGRFYGTTFNEGSGANGCSTIFEINPAGAFTTVHNFDVTEGCGANGLIQAADGNFYGTTRVNGANCTDFSCGGTVFEVTRAGALTVLYSFCSLANCADGDNPAASVVQGTDGNFYGTTTVGGEGQNEFLCGTFGCGTVFKITPRGKLTTLYSFCSLANCADGVRPIAPLIQAANGNFYGTTSVGGNCATSTCLGGTIFEITPAGALTTLYSFCSVANCADGEGPGASLVRASDGNLYGTTGGGGTENSAGTIFETTPTGAVNTVYNFCLPRNCGGSSVPGGLIQATDGIFYGMTYGGSSAGNDGTIYSFATGLSPFVSFAGGAAKIGKRFGILGQGFTGTTSVALNGNAASFTVKSDTLILATVPTGATTGYVTVQTPSGVLKSNVPFVVTK